MFTSFKLSVCFTILYDIYYGYGVSSTCFVLSLCVFRFFVERRWTV